MNDGRRGRGVGVLVALWLSAAAPASAAPMPHGTDGHGVSVDYRGGAVRVFYDTHAAARYSAIAGRELAVAVWQVERGQDPRFQANESMSETDGARVRRAPIATGLTDPADFVTVAVTHKRGRERIVAIVPTSRLGRDYLDQQDAVHAILTISRLIPLPVPFPLPAFKRYLTSIGGVFLRSEHSRPPGHKLGAYLSNNGQHFYAARRTITNKLLYVRGNGEAMTTNLTPWLVDPADHPIGPYLNQDVPFLS